MSVPHWFILLVILQRLLELAVSRRNTTRLLKQGAIEVGAGHYPLIVVLHVAWLAAMWLSVTPETQLLWPWLGIYVLLACGRVWVMTTLGRFWTTRIIHLPDAPLVRRGPYRFCRHPNYLIVAGEIAIVPLALGQWPVAIIFSVLNAMALAWRIRIENAALATRM
ncbi:MAG: isoprenylcysteine carboxyl methyltransferase family protein [Dongiaceae bacterium]